MRAQRSTVACFALIATSLAASAQASAQKTEGYSPGEVVTVPHQPRGPQPILGPRFAPVTIEFFARLDDGLTTARQYRLLKELSERHPKRLRVVFRLMGGRERSSPHMEAAQEAFVQGRFLSMIDEMYARNSSPRVGEIEDIAKRAGVDTRRLKDALADGRHSSLARTNYYYFKRRRLQSTFSMIINGIPYRRATTIEALESRYDEAYELARPLIDRGQPLETLHQTILRKQLASTGSPIVVPGSVDGIGPGQKSPPVWIPASAKAQAITPDAQSRGPEDAPVQVVFYCNFQTRNCGGMATELQTLAAAYPDEVRLIFRQTYSVADRRQRNAELLAKTALCADAQGRFWPAYDLLFGLAARGRQDSVKVEDLAKGLALDSEPFERCMARKSTATRVRAQRARALKAGVRHTPSLIIGGRQYTGTKPFDGLSALVAQELLPGVLGRLDALGKRP